ncbi:hypothetical protein TNCV_1674001 [Trichonephila clavipes]|nr:hypothetical protein TNCV_1674001 [Trichonephila clavipes]
MPSIAVFTPYGLASTLTGLEPTRACEGRAWLTGCSPSTTSYMSTGTSDSITDGRCNIPQDQISNLVLNKPTHCTDCIASSRRHTMN